MKGFGGGPPNAGCESLLWTGVQYMYMKFLYSRLCQHLANNCQYLQVVPGFVFGGSCYTRHTIPIASMYGTFAYIFHKIQPNVGKYTSPMDPMGLSG